MISADAKKGDAALKKEYEKSKKKFDSLLRKQEQLLRGMSTRPYFKFISCQNTSVTATERQLAHFSFFVRLIQIISSSHPIPKMLLGRLDNLNHLPDIMGSLLSGVSKMHFTCMTTQHNQTLPF